MQTITIEAATPESALDLQQALARFQPALREADDGRRYVEIDLGGEDCEIIDVLDAIEDYVRLRGSGAAHVGFNGRDYKLHPR